MLPLATSGMLAASTRLNVAAGNTANILTTGPLPSAANSGSTNASGFPSAYVPLTVNQVDASAGSGPSGTVATVSPVSPTFVAVSNPSAAFADPTGLVAAPNVDPVNLFVQAAIAKYAFGANADVARTDSQMTKSLLDILT
jgi:flagellar basal-body rod protein FlgC